MSQKKILAIDDDDQVLLYLTRKLGDSYTMITTTEPETVMRLVMMERPDLIMCDIDMPNMDGAAVCEMLSARPDTARIPFLYLTSMVTPSDARALGGMVGGRPGVSKRAPLPELIAAIEKMLL